MPVEEETLALADTSRQKAAKSSHTRVSSNYELQHRKRGSMKRIAWLISVGLLLPILSLAASFDCSKATSYSEKVVCSDKELSSFDESLAKLYDTALREDSSLIKLQRQWLKRRNACQDRECLVAAYQERISDLNRKENVGDKQVCSQLNRLVQNDGVQSLRERNSGRILGELCGYSTSSGEVKCNRAIKHPYDIAHLRGTGVDESQFTSPFYIITVSAVDINNDGIQDLRLSSVQGSASCDRSIYYFGSPNKKYITVDGSAFDKAMDGDGTRFCYGDGIVFLRIGEVTYTVFLEAARTSDGSVYRGAADGSFVKLCELSVEAESDRRKHTREVDSKVTQADEKLLLKQAIASIVEFEKPSELAILDEALSSEDILTQKVPRHIPEHQFSNWMKGVSRSLEQALLDNNTSPNGDETYHEKLLRNGDDYDFKDLEFSRKITNLGLIDKKHFAMAVQRKTASGPKSFSNSLAVLKFAKPAILGNKALVYVESQFVLPQENPDSSGAGYGILLKRQKDGWSVVERDGMWSGGSSFSAPH
jgi:uncharacterized protein YecT (DUF1311 family)